MGRWRTRTKVSLRGQKTIKNKYGVSWLMVSLDRNSFRLVMLWNRRRENSRRGKSKTRKMRLLRLYFHKTKPRINQKRLFHYQTLFHNSKKRSSNPKWRAALSNLKNNFRQYHPRQLHPRKFLPISFCKILNRFHKPKHSL